MVYSHLILLAPCHGFEDFPLYHTGDDAASMLASWTALWHPVLLHDAGRLPRIERCEYPPYDLENSLYVVPTPCMGELSPDLDQQAAEHSSVVISAQSRRAEIVRLALEGRDQPAPSIDVQLVRDFFAFGFAYLQVEVLTQQMRYGSTIDQRRVETLMQTAAEAALKGDAQTCRDQLTAGHDLLADERSHYYPVDIYFVDLTLVTEAASTQGQALARQLQTELPQNLLLSGQAAQRLAETQAENTRRVKQGLEQGWLSIAGGEHEETPIYLHDVNAVTAQLQQGLADYQTHLGARPTVFARRTNGLFPSLAHLLKTHGFSAALHLKYDQGEYPLAEQAKAAWGVAGQSVLDCYAAEPLDAAAHETFLNFPSLISSAMDTEHVATKMFVHWPGYVAPWYDDLRRAARFGDALGRWVTLDQYFADAGDSGTVTGFEWGQYRRGLLGQANDAEAGERPTDFTAHWTEQAAATRRSNTQTLAAVLADVAQPKGGTPSNVEQVDSADPSLDESPVDSTDSSLDELVVQSLAESLVKPHAERLTVINPSPFARRWLLGPDQLGNNAATGDAVHAAGQQQDGHSWATVDVPSMGFATVRLEPSAAETDAQLLADDMTLRNEFLQARIDPITGALSSVRDYQSRGTRLSQQTAFRITMPRTGQAWVDRQAPVGYSVMAADSAEVTENGPMLAEITTRGRMLALNGEPVGAFTQRFRIQRGSRVLELHSQLEPLEEMLLEDPWDSYYAFRFAFADTAARITAGAHWQAHEVAERRVEAPLWLELESGERRTAILTGGMPYWRRIGESQLDLIAGVQGQRHWQFRLGIAVDPPSTARAAAEFLDAAPPLTLAGEAANATGWLFHLSAKNVLATDWRLLPDRAGFCVRLIETEGRPTSTLLSAFRPLQSVQQVSGSSFPVELGAGQIRLGPHQIADLHCHWADA